MAFSGSLFHEKRAQQMETLWRLKLRNIICDFLVGYQLVGTFLYSFSMEQHRLVFWNAEIVGTNGFVGLKN